MILSLLATGMSMTSVANDNGSAFLRAGSRRTAEDTCDSIKRIICAMKNTAMFCEKVTELMETNVEFNQKLQGGTSFTVFAPTDEAFLNVTEQLEQLDDKEMDEVILFHFNEEVVKTYEDLVCTEQLTSLTGQKSRTKCRRKSVGVYLKHQRGDGNLDLDQFPIIDVKSKEACDGIIHRLDHVMLPKLYKPFKDLVPAQKEPPKMAEPVDEEELDEDDDDEDDDDEDPEGTDQATKIPGEEEDNTDNVDGEAPNLTTDPNGETQFEEEVQKKHRIGALGINLIIFSTLLLCFVFVCMRR